MPDSSPPSDSSPASPPDAPAPFRRRWGRRLLWGAGGLVGTLLLLVSLLLLGLQTERGATAAAQFLARQANPLPNTTLTVERASGNWVRSLRLTNVSLTRPDSTGGPPVTMAQLDTLAVTYRLGALLRGRLHLTTVSAAGPSVTLRQAADSTWDWMRVLPASEAAPADTSAGLPIRIDRVRLSRGEFAAAFYAGGRDSTARVEGLTVRARDLQVSPSLEGTLDTLGLRGSLPADTTTLQLAAAGALSKTQVRLDTLRLASPRSRVHGHGTARLPTGPEDTLDDVALTLRATPLVLGDLTAFAPTLSVDPRESITLDARLTGSGRRLSLTTEAQVQDGGRLTAAVEATPRTEAPRGDSLFYRIDAQADRLTTSLLGPADTTANTLSATVDATLRGRSLETLRGTVDARVSDSHLYGVSAPALALNSTVRDGTANVDLSGTLNAVSLAVRGTIRPFDPAPIMDLTTTLDVPSLADAAPGAGLDGTLRAEAEVRGRAMATDTASYAVSAALSDSRIGRQPISSGKLSLDLRPTELSTTAALQFPQGRLQAAGRAALDGSEAFALAPLRLDNVNVAALLGDTTASRVTGTVEVEGRGFSPAAAKGQARLSISSAEYGPHRMASLRTKAQLDGGRLDATITARLNDGDWSIAATARPFDDVRTAEITEGQFRNVDLGPFLQDTTQSSNLNGRFRGRVEGTTLSRMQLTAGLTLSASRINRQDVTGGNLDATLRDGQLQSRVALNTPEGRVDLRVSARPFDDTPQYRIADGSFENLNVGALAQVPGLRTGLSGTVRLEGRGSTLNQLSLDSELTLESSTVNRAPLSDGRLTVRTSQGRLETNGQFAVADGTLQLRGHLDSLATTPTYDLKTTARSLNVGALAGLDTLQSTLRAAEWRLTGRGTSLDSLQATTRLSADTLQVGSARLHSLRLTGRLQRGLLRLDTLTVQSNVGEVRGEGPLALTRSAGSSDFDLHADVSKIAPLRPFTGARTLQLRSGVVDAHLYGPAGEQRFDGTMELNGLIYDTVRLSDITATFKGERGTTQLLGPLVLNADAGFVAAGGFTATQTRLESRYDGTTLDLTANVQLDPERRISVETSVRPAADSMRIQLHQLRARMGPDRWTLRAPTTITVAEAYRVDALRLESGDQWIDVDGVVDPTGTQEFEVALNAVQLRGIAPLAGLTGLGGTATGALTLTGAATAPQLDGTLNLDLRSEDRPVGTLRLDLDYADLAATLDAQLTHEDGSVLTVAGSVPTDLRLHAPTPALVSEQPVRLDIATDQFPVNWIDPFLDPASVRSVTGTLTADAEVRGTLDDPNLSGSASVTNAGASLPALETSYRDGSASLQLTGNQLTLEEAVLRTPNDGQLRASGRIALPDLTVGEYDLTLDASDFLAIDTPAYRQAVVDGQMTLRGTVRAPVLTGTVEVQQGDVYYAEALAETGTMATVTLTPQDQLTLEERFGVRITAADTTTYDAYEALSLDLTVSIRRNTWLRSKSNPEMNVQFTGNLDVQKAPDDDPRVFGTIEVLEGRSTLRQFGQEFQITEGTLTFNGDPFTPYLNLTAVYDQRARGAQGSEVRITLSLSGRPDNLSPSLSSEPPMDTRNILSYLATGRPADALFSGNSEGGNIATQVALGQASNFVENLAASELGLDVVRLQVRPEGASYLTVGRYLTPRFFASIEQPVLAPSSQTSVQSTAFIPDVTLEYQLSDYLLLRSRSNQQSLQLNLLYEYAY